MLIVVSVRAQCSADCAFVPFEWISPVIGCSLELVALSDTRYVSRELYLFSIRDSGGLGRLEWEWNGQAGMGMEWASWNGYLQLPAYRCMHQRMYLHNTHRLCAPVL